MRHGTLVVAFVLGTAFAVAQESAPPDPESGLLRQWNEQILDAGRTLAAMLGSSRDDYRIGAEDLVEISVFEVAELSRTVRVSASGEISLPLLGTVQVVELSPMQLERTLTDRLRGSYLKDPQVSVFLREYKSDPVSVMGAVKMPVLYQIQTRKTLIEVLAMAQGFSDVLLRRPGRNIIISHSPGTRWVVQSNGPEEGNPADGMTEAESIEISIKQLLQSGDPKWNAPVYPGDVIKVVPAGTFYVAGNVNPAGRVSAD